MEREGWGGRKGRERDRERGKIEKERLFQFYHMNSEPYDILFAIRAPLVFFQFNVYEKLKLMIISFILHLRTCA